MVLKTVQPPTSGTKTPAFGFGTSGRTGAAMLIGSSNNKLGSMNRIYIFENNNGRGYQFIQYLISII
jgi:hypothetical protein